MSTQTTQKKKKGLASWKTRDLLVTAVIGIVFGFILAGVANLSVLLTATLTPQISGVLVRPFFVLAGVIAPYVIRKPGAAIISELVAGLVTLPFTPYGFITLVGRLIEGVVYEATFLSIRYRRWGWTSMILFPALAGIILSTLMMVVTGGFNLALSSIILLYVGNFIASGIGGAMAKVLADTIAKTGVLNSFAIGQEQQEEI